MKLTVTKEISSEKIKRSFLRNWFAMCEIISQSYTGVSWDSRLTLSLRNPRRATLDGIEAYADEGTILTSKRERSFVRNFCVIREFNTQRYNWIFGKQFANTVIVESVKGYFGANSGPMVKTETSLDDNWKDAVSDITWWCWIPHRELLLYRLVAAC